MHRYWQHDVKGYASRLQQAAVEHHEEYKRLTVCLSACPSLRVMFLAVPPSCLSLHLMFPSVPRSYVPVHPSILCSCLLSLHLVFPSVPPSCVPVCPSILCSRLSLHLPVSPSILCSRLSLHLVFPSVPPSYVPVCPFIFLSLPMFLSYMYMLSVKLSIIFLSPVPRLCSSLLPLSCGSPLSLLTSRFSCVASCVSRCAGHALSLSSAGTTRTKATCSQKVQYYDRTKYRCSKSGLD